MRVLDDRCSCLQDEDHSCSVEKVIFNTSYFPFTIRDHREVLAPDDEENALDEPEKASALKLSAARAVLVVINKEAIMSRSLRK